MTYTPRHVTVESLHDAITAMFNLWTDEQADEITVRNVHPANRLNGKVWQVDYWLPVSR